MTSARKQGFPLKPPAGPKRSHQRSLLGRAAAAPGSPDVKGKTMSMMSPTSFKNEPKLREMRLRFLSPRQRGLNGLKAVEEVYKRVLEPMYGCQDVAVEKLKAGLDRDCRVAYDPNNNPSTARGMLAYKFSPTIEHISHGLANSFELKTFLLMNTDDDDAMGYGTDLLRYAAAKALEAGADTMHITVSEDVASSVAFFIRRGFSLVHAWEGRYKPGVKEFLLAVSLQGKSLAKLRQAYQEKKRMRVLDDETVATDRPGSEPTHVYSEKSKNEGEDSKLVSNGSKKQRLGKEDSGARDAAQDIISLEGEQTHYRSPKSLACEEHAENSLASSSDTMTFISSHSCLVKPRANKGPLSSRILFESSCR